MGGIGEFDTDAPLARAVIDALAVDEDVRVADEVDVAVAVADADTKLLADLVALAVVETVGTKLLELVAVDVEVTVANALLDFVADAVDEPVTDTADDALVVAVAVTERKADLLEVDVEDAVVVGDKELVAVPDKLARVDAVADIVVEADGD